MIFVDSNILIDLLNNDPNWSEWSREQIRAASDARTDLVINPVVVAEIASNFDTFEDMARIVEGLDLEVLPVNEVIAFRAGQAFRAYRRQYVERDAILADFLIGAHAVDLQASLLTRDTRLYRRYFSDLHLITPESEHG